MDSSPSASSKAPEPTLPTAAAGVKRPAPSLLPPFEPLSSSPGLPRPSKRHANSHAFLKYPTPVPTSSTGILSSSPPRLGSRPALQRTQSTVSERAPLSDVPSVELSENGETVLMGRSSSSSHYQLSANRLISRVHVKARYIAAASPLEPNKVEVVCNGWNGLKLHCQGQTWELAKGDSFTSETEGAEIMIDVQDARVFVRWPRLDKDHDVAGHLTDSSWGESPRPRVDRTSSELHGSPLRRSRRFDSPVSPTPANASISSASLNDLVPRGAEGDDAPVEIYEDASSDERDAAASAEARAAAASFMTQVADSFSSDLSDLQSDGENEPNEENDPIIHSFGPFGANISSRFASFSTFSPGKPAVSRNVLADVLEASPLPSTGGARAGGQDPSATSTPAAVTTADTGGISTNTSTTGTVATAISSSSSPETSAAAATTTTTNTTTPTTKTTPNPASSSSLAGLSEEAIATLTNHVVNQLAFSRLSSTPLSTILHNLPADERAGLTPERLRAVIEATPCVGIIRRQGKDAAGKPLESEYYYTPELDADEQRRLAVTDGLRKPSLRNCRKQHKQYYWKRPRTP